MTEDQPGRPGGELSSAERIRRADLWEAGADERERLADERERLADERESLADERDRLADRQERSQDEREADEAARVATTGATDDAAEAAATEAAVRRAEAAVRRAEAELDRTREAAARLRARAALRVAASERAATARQARENGDPEESAWYADRRDFVAAEREKQATERDDLADRRDESAGQRERMADRRERDLLDRERAFARSARADRGAGPARADRGAGPARADRGAGPARADRGARPAPVRAEREPAADADARADGERQRARATAGRRAAAQERARAAAEWGPGTYGPMLLASFAPLARQLFASDNLRDVLAEVLKFTVGAVAGCECASVTLVRHGRVVETVTSDATAAELDDIQFQAGIGPAPEAMASEHPVHVADLAAAPRWPVLRATAAQLGVCSALSFGLYAHRPAQWSALGAFTLYGTQAGAFSDDDEEFGSILSAYTAIAVATAMRHDEIDRREAALHRALSTRDVIGQAKGILMERRRLSAGDAFDLLRRASQRLNRKLADVARELTETGELP